MPPSNTTNDDTGILFKRVMKALLTAVEESNDTDDGKACLFSPFVNLFEPSTKSCFLVTGHTVKQQQLLMLETIRSMQKSSLKRFFSALKSIIEAIVAEEAYVPESAFQDNDACAEEVNVVSDEKSTKCLHFLLHAASCVHAYLDGRIAQLDRSPITGVVQLQVLPQIYDVAADLHSILLSVHDCGPESLSTRNAILSLCESWWTANAVHRDTLIAQVLPLLVLQACDSNEFQKSQVKKLLKFKDAFQVIDFSSPSSDSLRLLLLRVASNPLCLKIPEGTKFLASLMCDPDLVPDLHLAFRAQIPEASKKILLTYGDIYCKAWKNAVDTEDDEAQYAIEHRALQDLMHSVIHIAQPAMATSILTLLSPLHSDKKNEQTASLLHRLYSPILWRSLSAANPLVRKNAVVILEQVFPLHQPSQNQMKAAVEKSCGALKSALQDRNIGVRIAGSTAAANICATFWEALPSADIRTLLNVVVLEHSSDIKSAAVRAAAMEATILLLGNPHSHAVLRPLLPSLGNLIHDRADRVRFAAVKLLQCIKKIPGIRFYHVVPVNHLTARLSEESRIHQNPRNAVAKELTALMLNSYFPHGSKVSASDQIQRTITFLLSEPCAATVFYSNLADILDVGAIAKFICMLLACVKSAVDVDQSYQIKHSQKRKKRRRGDSDDEDEHNLSASNVTLMAGMAETLCILLESIKWLIEEPANLAFKNLLEKKFSGVNLVNILSHFEGKALAIQPGDSTKSSNKKQESLRVCSAILRCAACLPNTSSAGLSKFIEASLNMIGDDRKSTLLPELALLASWGLVDEIASMLALSMDGAFDRVLEMQPLSPCFSESGDSVSQKKSGDAVKVVKIHLSTVAPKVGCFVIDEILKATDSSGLALRESILSSRWASSAIGNVLRKGTVAAEILLEIQSPLGQTFNESDLEMVVFCCEAYGRFVLHREFHQNAGGNVPVEIATLLGWITEKVVPILKGPSEGDIPLQDLDLSRISNVSDSMIVPGSPVVMSPPRQRANLNSTPDRRLSINSALSVTEIDAVAVSLLQSSCNIISEYLAVGVDLGDVISPFALLWCTIFVAGDPISDRVVSVRQRLLPNVLHVGSQLCKLSDNTDVLKTILINCDQLPMLGETGLIKKTFASARLVVPRHSQLEEERVVELFSSVAYELLESSRGEFTFKVATTAGQVWPDPENSVVALALEAISSHQPTAKLLTKRLVSEVISHTGDMERRTTFQLTVLSFLLPCMARGEWLDSIVNDLGEERVHTEIQREVLQQLIKIIH